MDSRPRHTEASRDRIGVAFIDLLFALVAAEILTGAVKITRHEVATGANFLVCLVVVFFSWIAYHRELASSPEVLSFRRPALLFQYALDVVIVGAYLLLVRQVEHTQQVVAQGHRLSIRPQAVTLVVVFGLYSLWDLLEWHLAPGQRARRHLIVGFVFLGLVGGLSVMIALVWQPRSTTAVVVADALYLCLLYVYRVLQESPAAATRA